MRVRGVAAFFDLKGRRKNGRIYHYLSEDHTKSQCDHGATTRSKTKSIKNFKLKEQKKKNERKNQDEKRSRFC